jgi:hypothetical protein
VQATNAEAVLSALFTRISEHFNGPNWTGDPVQIERNTTTPVELSGTLIILRDGQPGEGDRALGETGPVLYSHTIEVELYSQSADRGLRDQRWAALVAGLGAALDADTSLGGLTAGMIYSYPDAQSTLVEGAEDIKSGVLNIITDYMTNSRLG